LAWSGLTNVLRHLGALTGNVESRESLGLPPAVILDGRDPENYVNTDEPGFWENLLEPGDAVVAGDQVGRLWFPERPDRGPRTFTAPLDGVIAVVRAMTPTLAGDSLFVLGQPIESSAIR
jgi:N-alpha-acetyl-L-2,4-diaminobutyrate deacetylase